MRTLILYIGILIFLPSCGVTQEKLIHRDDQISYDIREMIDQVEIDNLQNIFVLTSDNRIVKYDSKFQKQFEYSNNLAGDIVSIDVTNPQKIICFVQDFNRILLLDNTLAEINQINLNASDYLDVSAIARSNDNLFWLFDPINQVLVKIDERTEQKYVSNRLSDNNFGNVSPRLIREKGNIVAILDENLGILIFDNFGKFLKLIPESGIRDFQIFGDYLFFQQDKKYYQYNIKLFSKEVIQNLKLGFHNFKMSRDYIYYINEEGLLREKAN